MVGGLEVTGAIDEVAQGIADVTDGDRTAELLGITWVSASAPGWWTTSVTAAMIPVVESLQGDGGDDALVGARARRVLRWQRHLVAAAANVAAAGMAARAGRPIGFLYFLKIGLPVTLVSMVIATAYVAVRYL